MAADPRLLKRPEAAAYCSLCESTFDDWVRRGLLPGPIPGTHRWDKKAIDLALDKLSGITTQSTPDDLYDQWKAGRDANAA